MQWRGECVSEIGEREGGGGGGGETDRATDGRSYTYTFIWIYKETELSYNWDTNSPTYKPTVLSDTVHCREYKVIRFAHPVALNEGLATQYSMNYTPDRKSRNTYKNLNYFKMGKLI